MQEIVDWELFSQTLDVQESAPLLAARRLSLPPWFMLPDVSDMMLKETLTAIRTYRPGARSIASYVKFRLIRRATQEYKRELARQSILIRDARPEAVECDDVDSDAAAVTTDTEYRDECILHDAANGRTLRRLAKKYNLHISTISRTISAAKEAGKFPEKRAALLDSATHHDTLDEYGAKDAG